MSAFSLVFCALLLLASSARGDSIYLHGGRVIEGEASVEGDKVQVAIESGRVTFARSEVERIEKSTSALQEATQREAALRPRDVAGHLQLAEFCRAHDLLGKERELLERILLLDEDHAEARRRLGYVRHGGSWRQRSELAQQDQLARREERLALEQRETELRLVRAKLYAERDRQARELRDSRARATLAADERAEREKEAARARREAFAQPYPLPYAYVAPLLYAGRTPPLSPPSGPPAFPIPGVRHPSDMSFALPGVRPPSAYFDGAFRR